MKESHQEESFIKGEVFLKKIDKGGKVIDCFYGKNVVVNTGRQNTARLLGGHASGKKITHGSFGDSGDEATVSDGGLVNTWPLIPVTVAYPTVNQVSFTYQLNYAEANGKEIQEIGLFNQDGFLFSRKTVPLSVKSSDYIYQVIWILTIS